MKKINLGCGWRNFGSEWIHIDGGDYDHLDYIDITKLEFDNNSVDLIYASHVLEYFDINEVKDLLREWRRVLKPGGELRVAVPEVAPPDKPVPATTPSISPVASDVPNVCHCEPS